MPEQSQYAAAANIPLIKSPSLRVPQPVAMPPDIHPLPDSVTEYFVYPFTLEPHVITLESSRRSTLAAHVARHEGFLRQRAEEKERRRKEALRRIAPGFEPESGTLVPVRMSQAGSPNTPVLSPDSSGPPQQGPARGHLHSKSVMDELVDHLAALDAASSTGTQQ